MLTKLLWSSFHDACKSNHYVVHLKIIECCMQLCVNKTGEKTTLIHLTSQGTHG